MHMHMRCTCDAHAHAHAMHMHMRCTAHAMHTRCTCLWSGAEQREHRRYVARESARRDGGGGGGAAQRNLVCVAHLGEGRSRLSAPVTRSCNTHHPVPTPPLPREILQACARPHRCAYPLAACARCVPPSPSQTRRSPRAADRLPSRRAALPPGAPRVVRRNWPERPFESCSMRARLRAERRSISDVCRVSRTTLQPPIGSERRTARAASCGTTGRPFLAGERAQARGHAGEQAELLYW